MTPDRIPRRFTTIRAGVECVRSWAGIALVLGKHPHTVRRYRIPVRREATGRVWIPAAELLAWAAKRGLV